MVGRSFRIFIGAAQRREETGLHQAQIEEVHLAVAIEIGIEVTCVEEHELQGAEILEVYESIVVQVSVADVAETVPVGIG